MGCVVITAPQLVGGSLICCVFSLSFLLFVDFFEKLNVRQQPNCAHALINEYIYFITIIYEWSGYYIDVTGW